ncbi:MAG TPA: hypothetical protein VJN89_10015 [Candidatus Acidoferrum sp.]|nr:hypothetical protein [Candidatus Acidoferrum sp.]
MSRQILWIRTSILSGALVMAGAASVLPQTPPIDTAKARQYFAEAKALSDKDNGALWKVPVCGPLLFADSGTRYAVGNQADAEGKLKPLDGAFAGTAPPELGVANTATKWAGVEWTMVMWPLPQYKQTRARLMLHECFHRVQGQIGLQATDAQNGHLDSLDGRIWLQMEWRALERAFWQQGKEREHDVADAVYFRNYRRSLFPAAAKNENALEMNEGLAEYTGFKLSTSSPEEYAVVVAAWLRSAPARTPSYGRSFAYTSGPAYGGLLDAASKDWRKGLTPAADFGQLLASAYGLHVPATTTNKADAMRRAERYEGGEVVAIETEKEVKHQARLAAARKAFLDGPVLILSVGAEFNYTFDPNAVLALDDKLTLYEGDIHVGDAWGLLKPTEGALFVRENGKIVRVQVPAPAAADASKSSLTGKGWTLDLKPGWRLVPEGRAGDFAARPEKNPPKNNP